MLLRYDIALHTTEVMAQDIWFANGVALGRDAEYVLFVETFALRIWKLWLTGEKRGRFEILLEHLPGFPDNLSSVDNGTSFWVGLVSRPSPLIASPLFLNRIVRALMAQMPAYIVDAVTKKVAGGVNFEGDGRVLNVIADPAGQVASSTPSGVVLRNMWLFMGNLKNDYITVTSLTR
jgi:sugar lactone lactonase YvrE